MSHTLGEGRHMCYALLRSLFLLNQLVYYLTLTK